MESFGCYTKAILMRLIYQNNALMTTTTTVGHFSVMSSSSIK